jgi:hypothetical protein
MSFKINRFTYSDKSFYSMLDLLLSTEGNEDHEINTIDQQVANILTDIKD